MTSSRERIEELRRREIEGEPLSADEQGVLTAFYARLDAEEAVYLAPAMERLQAERKQMQKTIAQLEAERDHMRRRLAQIGVLICEG